MTEPMPFSANRQEFSLGARDLEPALMQTLYMSNRDTFTGLAEATSVTFTMWASPRAGNPIIDAADAVIVDAANGVVKYVWAPGDTDLPGVYYGRFLVTLPGDRTMSWPDDDYTIIRISSNGVGADTPPPSDAGYPQPGGEVTGSWDHLEVEATHSGSSHAEILALAAAQDGTRGLFQRVWTVTDPQFGAAGDDATDDTDAILEAVAAAVAEGGVVFLPPGRYRAQLHLDTLVTLRGSGRGITTIVMPTNAADSTYVVRASADDSTPCDGMTIENLTIDGDQDTWGQDDDTWLGGLFIGGDPGVITRATVRNVEIVGCKSAGLVVTASGTVIHNAVAHDNGYTAGSGAYITAAGFVFDADAVDAAHVTAYSNAGDGFVAGSAQSSLRIADGIAYANGGHGYQFVDASLASLSSCIARQNTGSGFRLVTSVLAGLVGCVAESNGIHGYHLNGTTGSRITGSLASGNDTLGGGNEIQLDGTSTGNAIVGNVIRPTTAAYAINEAVSGDTGNTIGENSLAVGATGYIHLYSSASLNGAGSPAGVYAAGIGSTYRRRDGSASTSFYVKESGAAATTGWVAK